MLRYKSKKIIGTMMNTHIQCDGVRYQAGKKKHIFLVVSAMEDGGAERVAALLCNYWVAQGYEVTLMPTFSGRGDCVYPLDDRVYLESWPTGLAAPVKRSGVCHAGFGLCAGLSKKAVRMLSCRFCRR